MAATARPADEPGLRFLLHLSDIERSVRSRSQSKSLAGTALGPASFKFVSEAALVIPIVKESLVLTCASVVAVGNLVSVPDLRLPPKLIRAVLAELPRSPQVAR